jgi:hypothetical protein
LKEIDLPPDGLHEPYGLEYFADACGPGQGGLVVASSGSGRWTFRIVDLRTGAITRELVDDSGHANCRSSLTILDDRDGDGLPELAAGSMLQTEPVYRGRVLVWYSRDPASPLVLSPDIDGLAFGTQLCTTSDLDGDGLRELVVGAPVWPLDLGRAGEVWVLSLPRK